MSITLPQAVCVLSGETPGLMNHRLNRLKAALRQT
jgi:hypothetical protein